jgi:hypothetical protein
MRRPFALAMTVVLSGTALAACSSSSSSSPSTTTAVKIPTTLEGKFDCTQFETYATQVQTLVNSQTSASASTPAAEFKVITQLDAISGQAIDLLKPIAPGLVAEWHTQTQASLATLQAAVAKGVTASEFSSVIQSSNTAAYQKVSKQIGLIVHERCPSLSTTTTTTAGG